MQVERLEITGELLDGPLARVIEVVGRIPHAWGATWVPGEVILRVVPLVAQGANVIQGVGQGDAEFTKEMAAGKRIPQTSLGGQNGLGRRWGRNFLNKSGEQMDDKGFSDLESANV